MGLAFAAALQHLPPRQRAALVLREVLGYQTSEVAAMLDTTEASVKSALQRARATLDQRVPAGGLQRAPMPGSLLERDLVGRFATAVEQGDTKAVISLLTDDAWLTMPPQPYEYQGPLAIAGFIVAERTGRRDANLRLVPTRANGQPAFGCYLPDPQAAVLRAYGLMVLTLVDDQGVGDHVVRRAQPVGTVRIAADVAAIGPARNRLRGLGAKRRCRRFPGTRRGPGVGYFSTESSPTGEHWMSRARVTCCVAVCCLAAAPTAAVGEHAAALAPPDQVFHTSTFVGSELASVSCVSARACVAVGETLPRHGRSAALAERWNGTTWTVQRTPSPSRRRTSYLNAVSCPSARAYVAVGAAFPGHDQFLAIAERYSEGRWSIQRTRMPTGAIDSELRGVSCTSSASCIAVGVVFKQQYGVPLAERWDGHSWSVQRTAQPRGTSVGELNGVSCASAADCTAVGDAEPKFGNPETLVERWDGKRWSIQPSPNPYGYAELEGVSCPSTRACAAVGIGWPGHALPRTPVAERWQGSGWSIQPLPRRSDAFDSGLNGVSCTSANACTAVGWALTPALVTDAPPRVERWNGSPLVRPVGRLMPRAGLSWMAPRCRSVKACEAVGVSDGPATAETWNGTTGPRLRRLIGPEVPLVALEVAHAEVAGAVLLVGRLHRDLCAGRLGAGI